MSNVQFDESHVRSVGPDRVMTSPSPSPRPSPPGRGRKLAQSFDNPKSLELTRRGMCATLSPGERAGVRATHALRACFKIETQPAASDFGRTPITLNTR